MMLEVGKSYVNREGDVRMIVLKKNNFSPYQFVDEQGDTYSESGSYLIDGRQHMLDLVEEVKEGE